MLRGIKEVMTKNKGKMARAVLEDLRGSVPLTIFPQAYEACRDLLKEDAAVLVVGEMESFGGSPSVVVSSLVSLASAREDTAQRIRLRLPADIRKAGLERLRRVLSEHPGECPLVLDIQLEGQGQLKTISVRPDAVYRVRPDDSFFRRLEETLGEACVVTE